MAIENNRETIANAIALASTVTLGKEWGYYKRNIDRQKKEEKDEKEREDRAREGSNYVRPPRMNFRGGSDDRDDRGGGYGGRGGY